MYPQRAITKFVWQFHLLLLKSSMFHLSAIAQSKLASTCVKKLSGFKIRESANALRLDSTKKRWTLDSVENFKPWHSKPRQVRSFVRKKPFKKNLDPRMRPQIVWSFVLKVRKLRLRLLGHNPFLEKQNWTNFQCETKRNWKSTFRVKRWPDHPRSTFLFWPENVEPGPFPRLKVV